MTVSNDDVWAMYALWHWRTGIVGGVYGQRRTPLRAWAINHYFRDAQDYRDNCGKGKPFRIVRVDVKRAEQ